MRIAIAHTREGRNMTTKSITNRITVLAAVLGAMTMVAACNTVGGVGEDLQSGGKAIERTADDAK